MSKTTIASAVAARFAGLLGKADGDGLAARKMALSTFSIRVGGAALAFLSQIALARLLGAYNYGIFSVAWTIVIAFGVMACGGFSTSASRFISQYKVTGDLPHLRGFVFASRLSALVTGSGMAVFGLLVLAALRPVIDPCYVMPVSLTLLAMPFFAYAMVQDGIARSNEWLFLAMLPTYIWRPMLLLAGLLVAILAGAPTSAATAAVAAVCAALAVAVGQHVLLNRRLRPSLPPGPRRMALKSWILISLPMLIVDGFLQLITSADVIMVSFFEEPDRVAVYFAASKTLALVHFVYFAVRAASAHRFAGYLHRNDQVGLADYVRQAVHWTFWPSLAGGAVLLVIAPLLLGLFGGEFRDGYLVVALLLVGVLARASIGPADALLTMTGLQKICALIYGSTFVLNVIFNLAMIPVLGLAGAAIATSCAILFETVALAIVAGRKLGITTFIIPLMLARGRGHDQTS